MIEVKGVYKSYGEQLVLENIDLTVGEGAVFGLTGINGAGKSTLLRLISGVLKADKGEILIDGEPVYENETAKRKLFFLPDEPYYVADINAKELAELYKTFYNFRGDIYAEYLDKFQLDMKMPIRNFSKGMKRQVFISLALAVRPKYLLLDEAFDGLDPLARLVFKRGIIDLVSEGSSVVISSHSLRELEDISDTYGLLDHKTIARSGDLSTDLETMHKFQAAFEGDISEETLGFACMSFTKTGRVIQIVAKGNAATLQEKIAALHPLFVEEIPVDFEELFICEVTHRGYLK